MGNRPKLPASVAQKLLKLSKGDSLPASQFPPQWQQHLIEEGILAKQPLGRTRYKLTINSNAALQEYLANQYHIPDLKQYVKALEAKSLSGPAAQAIASDTKLRKTTFSGFLVTSYTPVQAQIGDQNITIHPPQGSFLFIEDYRRFHIPETVPVVGIENPENFKHPEITRQHFGLEDALHVCRYPQSKALIEWLAQIPNPYYHFGDFDLAGIGIYEREFKQYLGNRASMLIPDGIAFAIKAYGNRQLYDQQYQQYRHLIATEPPVQQLLDQIHELKMGLEQEFFIQNDWSP